MYFACVLHNLINFQVNCHMLLSISFSQNSCNVFSLPNLRYFYYLSCTYTHVVIECFTVDFTKDA